MLFFAASFMFCLYALFIRSALPLEWIFTNVPWGRRMSVKNSTLCSSSFCVKPLINIAQLKLSLNDTRPRFETIELSTFLPIERLSFALYHSLAHFLFKFRNFTSSSFRSTPFESSAQWTNHSVAGATKRRLKKTIEYILQLNSNFRQHESGIRAFGRLKELVVIWKWVKSKVFIRNAKSWKQTY